ncbi:PDDEXK nuclease domain-containing protein [Haliscomenobacter sp.]|uniref:PDDEXK nuclease domain-containing protein n=1 Tax=Haliscomenobacter sp. TaxID=2717303 RepID=UPI003BA98A28
MEIMQLEYKNWLSDLKSRIRSVQAKAAVAANTALIAFYWELGKMIAEKEHTWGDKLIEQLAKDLKEEFPEMKGFSRSNLSYAKQFYKFYQTPIVQQAVGQLQSPENQFIEPPQQLATKIPWGHNILIFSKSKDVEEAYFYIRATLENGWSRDILALQLKSQLYARQGKAISNFRETLPDPLSDLAQQTLKDPYIFDFLTMTKPYHEKDIERQLVTHITKFLLELGKGFAFVGQQYHLQVGETDYYIDLLFYHIKLKCYVVIELKNTKFMPEYAGKLNFYLSAVDSLVKSEADQPTIGILLCRDKNNFETEFALRDINKPMGVSEFQLTEILPDELKSSLPSIEEIENELKKLN